jgi:hypothetical protein
LAQPNPPALVRIEPEIVRGYRDRIVPTRRRPQKLREPRSPTFTTNGFRGRSTHRDRDRDRGAVVAAAYGQPADITTAKHRSIEVC